MAVGRVAMVASLSGCGSWYLCTGLPERGWAPIETVRVAFCTREVDAPLLTASFQDSWPLRSGTAATLVPNLIGPDPGVVTWDLEGCAWDSVFTEVAFAECTEGGAAPYTLLTSGPVDGRFTFDVPEVTDARSSGLDACFDVSRWNENLLGLGGLRQPPHFCYFAHPLRWRGRDASGAVVYEQVANVGLMAGPYENPFPAFEELRATLEFFPVEDGHDVRFTMEVSPDLEVEGGNFGDAQVGGEGLGGGFLYPPAGELKGVTRFARLVPRGATWTHERRWFTPAESVDGEVFTVHVTALRIVAVPGGANAGTFRFLLEDRRSEGGGITATQLPPPI